MIGRDIAIQLSRRRFAARLSSGNGPYTGSLRPMVMSAFCSLWVSAPAPVCALNLPGRFCVKLYLFGNAKRQSSRQLTPVVPCGPGLDPSAFGGRSS